MSTTPQRSSRAPFEASATMAGIEPHATLRTHTERNRLAWDRWAPYYRVQGRRAWADDELRWGMWNSLESDLRLLRHCEPGMNAIELGCGTGAVCAALARAGLLPVGVDISQAQLDTAHALQQEFEIDFRLDRADAEAVPYEAGSFDFATSEYGASVWCDPHRWIPEAARLLRPGGILVFLVTSPYVMTCTPPGGGSAGERLERPYFGMYRFDFATDDAVEFHLGHGDWVKVLTDNGFAVEDMVEVRPSPHAPPRYNLVTNEWARKWPSEDIWTVFRR